MFSWQKTVHVIIAWRLQKRPDVHKIILSIKLRSPPPGTKCQFWGFSTDLYGLSSVWAFLGGGGQIQILRTRIFVDTQTFWRMETCWQISLVASFYLSSLEPSTFFSLLQLPPLPFSLYLLGKELKVGSSTPTMFALTRVTFVIFESLWAPDPPESLFSHFWVTLIILGFRSFQEGINFTIQIPFSLEERPHRDIMPHR